MHTQEAIEMMRRCSDEIKSLRRHIDAIAPKAEAYDILAASIRSMAPRQGGVVGEDLSWMLDRRIKEAEAELAAEREKEASALV